jgi:hypothetical protein
LFLAKFSTLLRFGFVYLIACRDEWRQRTP